MYPSTKLAPGLAFARLLSGGVEFSSVAQKTSVKSDLFDLLPTHMCKPVLNEYLTCADYMVVEEVPMHWLGEAQKGPSMHVGCWLGQVSKCPQVLVDVNLAQETGASGQRMSSQYMSGQVSLVPFDGTRPDTSLSTPDSNAPDKTSIRLSTRLIMGPPGPSLAYDQTLVHVWPF